MKELTLKMPRLIGRLLLWYVIIYLVVIKMRHIIYADTLSEAFIKYDDPHQVGLFITSSLALLSYALLSYLGLHRYFGKVAWWKLLLGLILLIIGCMFFRAFLEEFVVYNIFGVGNYNRDMSWPVYLLDNLYYAIIFTALGIVFYFVQFGHFTEAARQRSELLQRETELKFLRSQVNPHFLFNTLNNLYSLVATESSQALPVIDKLSGLLRYSLYDHAPMVALDREIDYLKDFLELESLRVDGLVPPAVNFGSFSKDWQLPPLLLVPFIENAFKHGDLKCADRPLRIQLSELGDRLHFRVENLIRKETASQDELGGIGLNNVRKRLDLMYPGRYVLEISSRGEDFIVDLKFG